MGKQEVDRRGKVVGEGPRPPPPSPSDLEPRGPEIKIGVPLLIAPLPLVSVDPAPGHVVPALRVGIQRVR